jgi:hypothetical protein
MGRAAKKTPPDEPNTGSSESCDIDGGAPSGEAHARFVDFLCELFREWDQQDQQRWTSKDKE